MANNFDFDSFFPKSLTGERVVQPVKIKNLTLDHSDATLDTVTIAIVFTILFYPRLVTYQKRVVKPIAMPSVLENMISKSIEELQE